MKFEDGRAKCLSKVRYKSAQEAELEARWRFNEGGPELRPYDCIYCRGVHLTSRPKDDKSDSV